MADLKKREKILLGNAVGILITFVFNQFVCGSNPEAASQEVQQAVVSTQVQPKSVDGNNPQRIMIEKRPVLHRPKYSSWGRDPFYDADRLAEIDSTQIDSSDIVLRGIIWKGNSAHALIGDSILKEGESNEHLTILDIKKDRVVCKKGRKIITLMLRENNE